MRPDPDHYAPRWDYDDERDHAEPDPVCEHCDARGEVLVNDEDPLGAVITCPECDGEGTVPAGDYDIPKLWEL